MQSSRFKTPHDLTEKGRKAIAEVLNGLVADAFALYVKSKNYHWHLVGPHFPDYHRLFDEQADQILAMVDVLAERVRKLGHVTVRSIKEISRLQKVKEEETLPLAEEMMRRLREENSAFASRLRHAHEVCGKAKDVATCSILEVFLDETERRVWFLFSTES